MKSITIKIVGALIVAASLMVVPAYADVNCPEGSERYPGKAESYAKCNLVEPEAGSNDLWTTVNNIINVIVMVLGIAAVMVVIYGGINILLSQGDPGKIKKGKDAILYGIIGAIIAAMAFAIVNFILTGVFAQGV